MPISKISQKLWHAFLRCWQSTSSMYKYNNKLTEPTKLSHALTWSALETEDLECKYARPATVPWTVILAPHSTGVGLRNSVTGSCTTVTPQCKVTATSISEHHRFQATLHWRDFCLQCFDTVGWTSGRASGLWKFEWWGAGLVICQERGANDLHTVQLMPLPPHHLLLH